MKTNSLLILVVVLVFSCETPAPQSSPPETTIEVPNKAVSFDQEKEILAESVGQQGYLFGVPIMTMMYFRNRMHQMIGLSKKKKEEVKFSAAADDGLHFNELIHVLNLTNHKMLTAASPNTDTRYSIVFFNLIHGPQVLVVPPIKDRYWSMNITDAYLANQPYICSRLGDVNGGTYFLTGPDWKGEVPQGMIHRPNPQNNFFGLLRIYVKDPETDNPNVTEIQNQFSLQSIEKYTGLIDQETLHPVAKVPMNNGIDWFAQMIQFMRENPPVGEQNFIWNLFRQVGIKKDVPLDLAHIEKPFIRGIEKGMEKAQKVVQWRIENRANMTDTGWFYSDSLGEERNNYLERAEWAVQGLICNSPAEAMYFNIYHDLEGKPLEGSKEYEIHIPADKLPPVDAFWSITSYTYERNFIPNDDLHYGVGMRNKQMKYNKDGSLTFKVQNSEPKEGRWNWIPTTQSGRFRLNFRFYNPKEVMFDKTKVSDYLPPLVEKKLPG